MASDAEKHTKALDAGLKELFDAAKRVEDEVRSGSKLNAYQLRMLRMARRSIAYVEDEYK